MGAADRFHGVEARHWRVTDPVGVSGARDHPGLLGHPQDSGPPGGRSSAGAGGSVLAADRYDDSSPVRMVTARVARVCDAGHVWTDAGEKGDVP
ncbi:hypothetical protein GCM10010103_56870 [Streptomyces paradoxus]